MTNGERKMTNEDYFQSKVTWIRHSERGEIPRSWIRHSERGEIHRSSFLLVPSDEDECHTSCSQYTSSA